MFDLFRSREKSVRILLGVLLVVVALSMLTYLVPNYDRSGNTADSVVAQVGSDKITVAEVDKLIQGALRGRSLPPDLVSTYVPQMVDDIVSQRALEYEADRLGLQVSDDDVRQAIRSVIPDLFPDGKFAGKDAYAQILGQRQLTIQEFESDLRRQVLISKLRDIAIEGTVVSQAEIEDAYRQKNDKLKIQYVKVTGDKFKNEVAPSTQDLQNYYQANQARFVEPEKKDLVILIADQAKVAETLTPTDADLHSMYDRNKEQFRVPERVKARRILLKTQGKPPAEDAKAKAKADDLLKQVRGGGNFADLAKKNSEDTQSAAQGGDLGWIQRGQTLPEFEKVAFALKPGETSGVVKTDIGYDIIQASAHEDAHLQTYDEVKPQLTSGWKNAMVNSAMSRISDQAQTLLQKDPLHPDQVAAQLHMDVVRATGIGPGKDVPVIGTNGDFDQSIAGLKQGQVSQLVQLPGNKLALAVVSGISPARPSTFDEASSQMREAMIKNRLEKKVRDVAQEIADKAKANGGDLAAAAKAFGLTVATTEEFTRTGAVTGLGSAAYASEGFSRPDGTVFGPVPTPEGSVIAKVAAHVPADLSQLAAQRAEIRDQIKGERARQRNTLFEAGLKDDLQKHGKIKYHQDVIDRLVNQYRTS